ncbi:MAG: hypothetical protein K2N39_06900 [Lachnospiraceae bacterium]|nr:hypothetical protein [Lachnospiraceae bacterium]
MKLAEWKEKAIDMVRGELTLTKLDFCLIGAICFLAGVCMGMIAAPLTHGITVLSHNTNNGSGNGSKNGNNYDNQ